jgi:hypothetical protein
MKFRFFYVIFLLLILQNTEGYAQDMGVDSVETATPIEAIDGEQMTDEEMTDAVEEPYRNPFEDAWKKYYSEDVKQQDFDKDSYQKATAGLDYTIEKKEEKEKKGGKKASNAPPPNFQISPIWVAFLQWFFIFGAVLILGFLIYKFIDGGNVFTRSSRRINVDSVALDLEKIEENLQEIELDPHIKKAIAQKQFALATRLYYLAIIKEMSAKSIIVWKKDKTNRAYLNETKDNKHFPKFKTMTGIYERVWYGDSPIDESAFMMIQPAFQDLLKILRGVF